MKIKFRVSTEELLRTENESFSAGTVTFTERGIYLCLEGDGTSTTGTLVSYDGLSTENFLNKSTGASAQKPNTDLYDGRVFFDTDVEKMYVAMGGVWKTMSGDSTSLPSPIEVVTVKPDNSEGENNNIKVDSVAKVFYLKSNNVWETIGISESMFNDLVTRVTALEQELTIHVTSLQDVISARANTKGLYMPFTIHPDIVALTSTNFETLIQGVDLSDDTSINAVRFSTPIVVENGKADSICQHTILLKNGINDYKGLIFAVPSLLTCVAEVKSATECIGNSVGGVGGNKKLVKLAYTTSPTTVTITGTSGSASFTNKCICIALWKGNQCTISVYNPDTGTFPVQVTNQYSNNQVLGIIRGFGAADTTNLYAPYTNNIAVVRAAGIKASSTQWTNTDQNNLKALVSEYQKLWL